MKKHEAEKLVELIKSFVDGTGEKLDRPHQKMNGEQVAEMARIEKAAILAGTNQAGEQVQRFDDPELERLYLLFKHRLLEELPIDPVALHLLTTRPEIVVDVERKIVEFDTVDLKGRIAQLIAGGFLADVCSNGEIRTELARRGSDPNSGRLTEALQWLQKAGFLTRESAGWRAAPGVKVTERRLET